MLTNATATSEVSSPGTPKIRGFTPSCASAASKAFMPVYLPLTEPPIMADVCSAASAFCSTRTTTVAAFVWSAMACNERANVPFTPAESIAD